MAAHPDAIALPESYIESGWVRVAAAKDETPLGFSVVIPGNDGIHELDGLFVEPSQMHRGVGRALVEDAAERALARAAAALEVTAGPAVGFYEKLGFRIIGSAPTRFGPAVCTRRELNSAPTRTSRPC